MAVRVNRRDQIVETACKLFVEQGYNATSVRQIAGQVGVTEAALYYHFKEGKRELLQRVVENEMPDLLGTLDSLDEAGTLYELVLLFGERIALRWQQRMERLRWVIAEFPLWSDAERELFHAKHLEFQRRLVAAVERFVASHEEAVAIAMTLICATFGYGQLFLNLDMGSVSDFTPGTLAETLACSLARGAKEAHHGSKMSSHREYDGG